MSNRRPRKYKKKHMRKLSQWKHSKALERRIRPMRSYPCRTASLKYITHE